jgi:hypothetical protein
MATQEYVHKHHITDIESVGEKGYDESKDPGDDSRVH